MTKDNESCQILLRVSTIYGKEETCMVVAKRYHNFAITLKEDILFLSLLNSSSGIKCSIETTENNYVLKFNMIDEIKLGGCHDLIREEMCASSETCMWSNGTCVPMIMGGCHDLYREEMCANSETCMWSNGTCVPMPMMGGCHDLFREEMCASSETCMWSNGTCVPKSLKSHKFANLKGGCHDFWKVE
jgi:hypothetical protein